MAKVTGPLFSLTASGSVGPVTISPRRGQHVVREKVIPANPNTASQQTVRNKFQAVGKILARVAVTNLKITALTDTFEAHYRNLVTEGQVWNSVLSRRIMGAAFASFDADVTAYNALSMSIQDAWTAQATIAGMTDTTRGDVTVEAGLQMYMLQRAAAADGYGTFVAATPQVVSTS